MSRIALAIILTAAWGWSVEAQQPSASGGDNNTAGGTQNSEQTLTPEQQREERIRKADPLDQSKSKDDKDRDQREKADRDTARSQPEDQTPTPGSIAAEERNNATAESGPEVVSEQESDNAAQNYTGPAVLSRSYSVDRPVISQQLKWSESLGVNFVDDTGAASSYNSNGSATSADLLGAMVSWGFAGRHAFKRDQIAVSYNGNYTRYGGNNSFSGGNHTLSIDYKHVLSRRLSLELVTTGAIWSQNFNYTLAGEAPAPGTTVANINLATSPSVQVVDYGAKQFSSQANFVWQKSARMSFDGGVTYFLISWDNSASSDNAAASSATGSPGLVGMTGEQAQGEMTYRLTRKMTVGSYYSFSHYLFAGGWGMSDTNTMGGIFSYALTKTMQVRLRAGASVVDSRMLQSVPIPPAIALLLGQSSGLVDVYSLTTTTDISAQAIKDFRRGKTVNVAFAHGVMPGNGYLLTAVQESISAGYGMPLFRRYMFQATVGRNTLTSVGTAFPGYQTDFGTLSISRRFEQGVNANFSATYRHFDYALFPGLDNQFLLSAGLNWGSTSGRLWPF